MRFEMQSYRMLAPGLGVEVLPDGHTVDEHGQMWMHYKARWHWCGIALPDKIARRFLDIFSRLYNFPTYLWS
jgi:hypothetical protein